MAEVIHLVMGGGIVLAAYRADLAHLAYQHSRCITGATVTQLDLDSIDPLLRGCIEILTRLPPEISADINTDWEGEDDITPKIVEMNDIKDAKPDPDPDQ